MSSSPVPPVNLLLPLLPLKILFRVLPVASILLEPVRFRFSTSLERVKLTEEKTWSVPSEDSSVTVSLVLSTT